MGVLAANAELALVAVELDPIAHGQAHPVGAPGRAVEAEHVVLEDEVVPPEVETDRRLEAELEERGRDQACVAIREREERDQHLRHVVLLGVGDEPAEGPPHAVLADQVQRRERQAWHPDRDVSRVGRLVAAPVVVRDGS
jgi:hypothetical protein